MALILFDLGPLFEKLLSDFQHAFSRASRQDP